jgi:exodeoxyribonuclease-3
MIRLVSWNVNGLRASIKKGFWDSILSLKPDTISIQETKSDQTVMLSGVAEHPEFRVNFHSCSIKKGYSGVATFSKIPPVLPTADPLTQPATNQTYLELVDSKIGLDMEEFDVEGRLITTKYKTNTGHQFTLINGYFPQGGRGPERIAYKIKFYEAVFVYAQELRTNGEKVIICGDLNTTVSDIDLARPNENRQTTGCLPEEREVLNLFLHNGFIDSFRYFYPNKTGVYSYWDQITRARERNNGWRIDYFLVDETLLPNLKAAYIWSEIMGSDHCPVGIDLGF